jgi:hypothetical protein
MVFAILSIVVGTMIPGLLAVILDVVWSIPILGQGMQMVLMLMQFSSVIPLALLNLRVLQEHTVLEGLSIIATTVHQCVGLICMLVGVAAHLLAHVVLVQQLYVP